MLRFAVPPTSCPGFDTFFDQHLFFRAHACFQGTAFAPLVVVCGGGLARSNATSDALAKFLSVAHSFEDLERRKKLNRTVESGIPLLSASSRLLSCRAAAARSRQAA